MFFGRAYEVSLLKQAIASPRAELIILYGRRRVGKSALLQRLRRPGTGDLYFEGLQKGQRRQQLRHFLGQLAEQTGTAPARADDWRQAFQILTPFIERGSHYIVFDELPWMAAGRSELVALLKYFWDNKWKQNPRLTLVLCGSIASFMLRHVLHSEALHNRKTLEIKLPPLSADEAKPFFKGLRNDFEVAKYLMVFGGVPKYLEQVDPSRSFLDNLDALCFKRHAFFLDEFDTIFKEQFKVYRTYERIIRELSSASLAKERLFLRLGASSGGGLASYLKNLEHAEFIKTFSPTSVFGAGTGTRTSKLVLWDEWLRFYFSFVEPNRQLIETSTRPGLCERLAGPSLPAYFGLAFERLCMKNLPHILDKLGMDAHQILGFGPFFRQRSRKDATDEGLQIDILVHRPGDVLTLIECRFSQDPVGMSVIDEVERKIRFLKAPSRFTVERILLCPGGVTLGVQQSGYFHRMAGIEVLF